MTKSKIIVFPGNAAVEPSSVLPETAEHPQRKARLGRGIVSVVEAAVTVAIGLCVITCTVAVLAMV